MEGEGVGQSRVLRWHTMDKLLVDVARVWANTGAFRRCVRNYLAPGLEMILGPVLHENICPLREQI